MTDTKLRLADRLDELVDRVRTSKCTKDQFISAIDQEIRTPVRVLEAIVEPLPKTADGVVVGLGMTIWFRNVPLVSPVGSMLVETLREAKPLDYVGSCPYWLRAPHNEPYWSTEQLAWDYHVKCKQDELEQAKNDSTQRESLSATHKGGE